MAVAVTLVSNGGMPITPTRSTYATPMTMVADGGLPATLSDNGMPITWVDKDGNPMDFFYVIGKSAVKVDLTGTGSETALATVTIPANAMGPNGILRVTALWTYTSSTNAKTLRVRFGNGLSGTAFQNHSATNSTAVIRTFTTIQNRNSAASQIAGIAAGTFTATTTANVTGTIDTTAQQTLTISGLLGSTGETISLESYIVELSYGA